MASCMLGLTPPHGRGGHSVPTPRPLDQLGQIYAAAAGVKSAIKATRVDHDNSYGEDGAPQVGWPRPYPDLLSSLNNNNNNSNSSQAPLPWYPHRDLCASPLDRLRPVQYDIDSEDRLRPVQYEEDRSATLSPEPYMYHTSSSDVKELQRFTGNSMLSVSYNPTPLAPSSDLSGSFVSAFSRSLNTSLNVPFLHQPTSSPTNTKETTMFPTVSRSPYKALVTIDAISSVILIANSVSCDLFHYSHDQLVGMRVQQLFTEPYRARQRALVEQNIDNDGETVLMSGKVMDAVSSFGVEFPVSVWMKRVTMATDPRVIVVIEPVQRTSANFTIDNEGMIFSCDPDYAKLFGCDSPSDIMGYCVTDLIPSIALPSTVFSDSQPPPKQMLTGRTRDGSVFPLTVRFIASAAVETNKMTLPESSCDVVAGSGDSTPLPEDAGCHEQSCSPEDKSHDVKDMSHGVKDESHDVKDESHDVKEQEGDTKQAGSSSHVDFFVTGKVIVYSSLSGMVSLLPDGTIHGCNHHFALMLFGYTQQELVKKHITHLIPEYYTHISYVDHSGMPFPPLSEDEMEHELDEQDKVLEQDLVLEDDSLSLSLSDLKIVDSEEEEEEEEEEDQLLPTAAAAAAVSLSDGFVTETIVHFLPPTLSPECDELSAPPILSPSTPPTLPLSPSAPPTLPPSPSAPPTLPLPPSAAPPTLPPSPSAPPTLPLPPSAAPPTLPLSPQHSVQTVPTDSAQISSTPLKEAQATPTPRGVSRLSSVASHTEGAVGGTYSGLACHKDGSLISIVFQLKQIALSSGQQLVTCVWITRDHCDPTSPLQVLPSSDKLAHSLNDPQEEALATDGEYSRYYETLGSIGRGAFGFVKMAQHKELPDLMVVVKFLRKSSIIAGHWVQHDTMGLVPSEIALLAGLSHDNIVQLLEAYENEHYFQLVMEKHGNGMDLFSFIETNPHLDEPLISYLFRQVVAALNYLHSINIIHRDVKDENIILDHNFHVKLIDFGSATHMKDGIKFNTFCGTIEYCSPEVLLGNRYSGPELEMWSLGVTLYTLVFGENPFFDVEEIITGRLQPPFLTSPGLMKVLLWLLHPDPHSRATLADLMNDKWTNQIVDITKYSFEAVIRGTTGAESTAAPPAAPPPAATDDQQQLTRLNNTFS